MLETLAAVRKKAVIGFVGGSDLVKIAEQLAVDGKPGEPSLRIHPFERQDWIPDTDIGAANSHGRI